MGRRGRLLRKWREGMKMAPSSKSERNSGAGSGGGGTGGAGGKRTAGRRREHVLKQLERVKVRPRVWMGRAGGCGRGTREAEGGRLRGEGLWAESRVGGSEGGSGAAPRGEGLDAGAVSGLGWRRRRRSGEEGGDRG